MNSRCCAVWEPYDRRVTRKGEQSGGAASTMTFVIGPVAPRYTPEGWISHVHGRVAAADRVHERGEPVGEVRVGDLQHVLGVLLARV
jgi:hypothetical protein